VSENRALKRIFGPYRKKVTRWKTFHIMPFIKFIRINKSRRIRSSRYVESMREYNIAYKVLVRNSEGRRPFGRSRHNWEDNVSYSSRMGGRILN
jgi:hypothetical protein